MFLRKLKLSNFKNYDEADISFSDKINCFVGNNGVGKTNILDAIYYLSFCKSYFNTIDSQNIKHDCDFFAIHGIYNNQSNSEDKVSCIQKRNHKKAFKINSSAYKRLADHIGLIPLVMISPYDRDLINDGSELRRKYIDGVISQFDRTYLNELINYNKTLQHRNSLLKQIYDVQNNVFETISILNKKLKVHGEVIFDKRMKFIEEFNPIFENYYKLLSNNREKVRIKYTSQLMENDFSDLLEKSFEKDGILKYTTCGIHKDDLVFMIDDYNIKKYGSQGQQKSFVIAIKLAQFEFTRMIKNFKPILLFDDIFDKLDDNRVTQIIKLVSDNNFGQIFITDTQRNRIERVFKEINIDHKIFNVIDGVIQTDLNNI